MAYSTIFLSIRMKLDDVIKDIELEKQILENIRYCRKLVGEQFRVIFWNESLTDKQCEEFVKRNEKMLFEISTQITSTNSLFDTCWFLINTDGLDKCSSRYKYKGDILTGITEYIKMVKHFQRSMDEDSDNR